MRKAKNPIKKADASKKNEVEERDSKFNSRKRNNIIDFKLNFVGVLTQHFAGLAVYQKPKDWVTSTNH